MIFFNQLYFPEVLTESVYIFTRQILEVTFFFNVVYMYLIELKLN